MAIAVAVLALSGVSVPLVVIAMAILAVIYLLTRAAEWLSEVLHEKSLSDSIRAVTEAFKMLFIPGYAVFKLLKMLAPSGKKASKVFKGMLDKVRGIGAWIRNIVPEPLMDFADAILQHLPNPLTILENAATILEGFFDIISGDWETGKTKIITGVKNIILELAKIPLMLPKIGIEIIKQLWEGIKSFVGWLKEKIIGGSLVWDIVGWFAMLPLQLFEIGLKMLGQLFEGIAQKISGFLGDDGIGGVIGDIVGLFLGIPAELLYIGADMINYLWSGLKLWWDLITQGEFTALIVEIIAFFVGIPGKLFEYGKSMMTKLKEGILEIIPAIFGDTVLGKFLTDLTTFFADLAISFFDWGKHLIDELVRGIRDKGPDVVKEILKHITPIPVYMPTSPAKKGPLKDLRNWGQGFYGEFGKGLDRGFRALGMMDRLGEMGPAGRAPPMTGGGDVTLQNEFVIYATIRDQQDLLTLRDEISMKQLEQARRTRVLTGAW
jgi:hypothetical protein